MKVAGPIRENGVVSELHIMHSFVFKASFNQPKYCSYAKLYILESNNLKLPFDLIVLIYLSTKTEISRMELNYLSNWG